MIKIKIAPPTVQQIIMIFFVYESSLFSLIYDFSLILFVYGSTLIFLLQYKEEFNYSCLKDSPYVKTLKHKVEVFSHKMINLFKSIFNTFIYLLLIKIK